LIIKGKTECPTCKKEHPAQFDIDKLTMENVKVPEITNPQASGLQTQQLQNPELEIKEIVKTVAPKDQPFYKCKNCGDKHENPNYSQRPNMKCPNCGSLNGEKNCKNCKKNTDLDEWEELDNDELNQLEIPEPKKLDHKQEGE